MTYRAHVSGDVTVTNVMHPVPALPAPGRRRKLPERPHRPGPARPVGGVVDGPSTPIEGANGPSTPVSALPSDPVGFAVIGGERARKRIAAVIGRNHISRLLRRRSGSFLGMTSFLYPGSARSWRTHTHEVPWS